MAFGEVRNDNSFDTGVMAGTLDCHVCEPGVGCEPAPDCEIRTPRGKLVCDPDYNCKEGMTKCKVYGGADGGHCEWN